jgi:hypothetical protein
LHKSYYTGFVQDSFEERLKKHNFGFFSAVVGFLNQQHT